MLAGVFSFILYSLGAAEFAAFSPLRYTALTAALGWLTIAGATLVAITTGLVAAPDGRAADVGLAADRVPRDPRARSSRS